MARILIIDDDHSFHDLYRGILAASGYEVVDAYGPEEGLEMVKSQEPDLIILDIMMPDGFEGFDVARKIREDLQMPDLPIIVMSAIHDVKQIPYRFAPDPQWLPIDLWLDKPFSPDALLNQIKAALNETPGQPG
jgi:DNA-binding response OmpR family regulator